MYDYDDQNIFAKILRGEIPNDTVLETQHSLAFNDIQPQAPIHVLVIPKGPFVTFDHFVADATEDEIVDFNRAVGQVCHQTEATSGGYRLISNAFENAIQEVPHMHVHVLGGRGLGRILPAV